MSDGGSEAVVVGRLSRVGVFRQVCSLSSRPEANAWSRHLARLIRAQ